ncbi:MAG: PPOX class F420-dependent oxidoreductase, partial [Betaproteobacteria bacterium]|nr:PPOX class F420-dependent oxidoreductase [Betaproteobacteria bacterium]
AVRFEFDGEYFYVGGRSFLTTLKYKNVYAGNTRVALVLDDIDETIKGPRGIKVHGHAEIVEREGHFGAAKYLRITPERSWSWGIERAAFENGKPVFQRNSKKKSH